MESSKSRRIWRIESGSFKKEIQAENPEEAIRIALIAWNENCETTKLALIICVANEEVEWHFDTLMILDKLDIPYKRVNHHIACKNCENCDGTNFRVM